MQYKDILLYIDDGKSNADRIEAVLGLARVHGATVTGVTLAPIGAARANIIGVHGTVNCDHEAQKRLHDFEEKAKASNVSVRSHIISSQASEVPRKLAQYARNFDLVVLRQSNPEGEDASLIGEVDEQVLLLCGRPVFFMPFTGAHRLPFKKAAVAWDGTPAATRALHNTLPILVGVDEVMILIIEGKKKTERGELLVDDLIRNLKNHGVNAVVNRKEAGTSSVPTVILDEISKNDIDVLVMGGYGTPNIQQKIFGGVTRTLLGSMTVPVVMSH